MNITVNAVNDVPVATGNTVIASEDVPLVIGASDFSFTDVESDSLASVTITGLTLNGGTLTHSAGAVTVTISRACMYGISWMMIRVFLPLSSIDVRARTVIVLRPVS